MTLDDLQNVITQALTVAAQNHQPFSVTATALGGSPNVATLFNEFLVNATLALNGAAQTSAADASPIVVSGTLAQSFLGSSGLQATAAFSIVSDTAQVTITLTGMPAGWKLSDAITVFADDLYDGFTYANPAFTLDSQALAGLGANFPNGVFDIPPDDQSLLATLKTGLSLSATVTWATSTDDITWFIGTQPFNVTGPLEISDAANTVPTAATVAPVQMQLASGIVQTIALGTFSMPFMANLYSVISLADDGSVLTSTFIGVSATASLQPPQAGVPEIPMMAQILDGQLNTLLIASDLSNQPITLDAIAAMIGVAVSSLNDVMSIVENFNFPVLDNIGLLKMRVAANVPQASLLSASATIGQIASWSIFDSLFTFHDIALTFTLIGSTLQLETSLVAEVDIGGASINGQAATISADAELPGMTFSCELLDGENRPIEVGQIVNHIVGNTITMPAIHCTEFKAFGNIASNYYRFQTTVTDDWVFNLGSTPLALTSISFDLTYDAANQGTSGEIVSQFNIAGVQAYLSAAYDASQGGWTFGGGTAPNQQINLNDLVNDALDLFGIPNLPTSLPQVTITDIDMSFWTATGDVVFGCAGQIVIVNTEVDIDITLSRIHADGPEAPATTIFVGHLKVGGSLFEVDFMTGTTTQIFASWQGEPISLEDLAGWLGLTLPQIPQALNLTLTALSFAYNFDLSEFVLMASSADSEYYKNAKAVFLFISHESATPFAFNMAIDVEINLSNLPLIGSELQSLQTIDIDNISVLIASGQFTKPDVTQLNTLITTYAAGYPTLPIVGVEAGLSLNVPFNFGGTPLPAQVPVVPAVTPGTTPVVTPPVDSTFWVNVQKSFGPVTFKRVGVLYQDEQLYFKLDASLAFGGLGLTLNGLSVSSPLTTFSPSFHLDGLGVAFVEGPLEIAGAFLSEPVDPSLCTDANDCYEYAGGVTIMFEEFGFAAIGAYAKLGSFASLFVFGEMDFPLGGIPAFFVTGLNGGFGYNSSLRIPGINEVYRFPFVAGLTNPDVLGGQGGNPPTPLDVLNVLERGTNPWVRQVAGQDWLAAGISFTTYELVDSRALLVAEFGRTFELALIGLATMQLPKGLAENSPEVFVYVELQLEAVFIPDDGFIGLSATLSPNSFLLDKNCHPTGGFALYVWFLGDHAGDFTLSIGGYHPSFTVPAWYPKVARVGFNWPVSKEITITGQAYCALTPAMIMAGGLLNANYQDGDLKAWFTAQADFLISWLPFYYQASIGVSVGASYKLSICGIHKALSAEIGATLDLWGPRTGGQVKVQWSVISFTVSFGATKNLVTAPLDWNDFEQNLLPAAESLLTLAINSGLLGIDNDSQPDASIWLVRPSRFAFTANSSIPASAVELTNPSAASLPTATNGIAIQPMSKTSVASMITLEVLRNGATFDMSAWSITARTANVPVALWGAPVAPPTSLKGVISQLASQSARNVNAPPTVNQLVGFSIAGPTPVLTSSTAAMAISALGAEPIADPKSMPLAPAAGPLTTTLPTEQATMVETIMQTVNEAMVAQTRTAVYDALQTLYQGIGNSQAFPDTNGSLAILATEAGGIYTDPPLAQ